MQRHSDTVVTEVNQKYCQYKNSDLGSPHHPAKFRIENIKYFGRNSWFHCFPLPCVTLLYFSPSYTSVSNPDPSSVLLRWRSLLFLPDRQTPSKFPEYYPPSPELFPSPLPVHFPVLPFLLQTFSTRLSHKKLYQNENLQYILTLQ